MADIPDDAVERLARTVAESFEWDWPAAPEERIPSAVECCEDTARAVIEALRDDPALAATVLGGKVRQRSIGPGWLEAPDGEMYEIPARDQARVVGPWTEVAP